MSYAHIESGDNGLELSDGAMSLRIDFTEMLPRLRQDNLSRELLVRAAKIKKSDGQATAIDMTAGLGEDSLLLAATGFHVHMYEKDPRIAALLRDALSRARDCPQLLPYVERMHLTEADSLEMLSSLSISPDVIYLDPMFPARKKSAAVKKKFQLLHQLALDDDGASELLSRAVNVRPRKIIIKRPLKGPYLGDAKPSYSIKGKAIRFDCLVFA